MGLRCSLIGHDWGESEIERDRDEQGSEVVLTVREYEVCTRCEERNLISENTEVTTLEAAEDGTPADRAPEPTRDGANEPAATGDDAAAEPTAAGADATGDDATDAEVATIDDAPPEGASTDDAGDVDASREASAAEIIGSEASAGAADATGVEAESDDDADAATDDDADAATDDDADAATDDDAVIIDDADGEDVAAAADSPAPDADATAADSADAPPDDDGHVAAEASSASAAETGDADDDGVILDDDDDEPQAREREHGEWPAGPEDASQDADAGESGAATASQLQADASVDTDTESAAVDEDGFDAEFIDKGDAAEDSAEPTTDAPAGIKSAGSTAPPGERHRASGKLVCPNCQNAESAERTSLRAGDICPECRRGYLSDPGE
jgi:hypothetical protein